ncbi:MAG: response regulator [Candidatus Aenigmarchaeota archaeon]|nr:response regulator [Candidatus Aenigmarchaeota archaeon]
MAKILVVDDEERVRDMLQFRLSLLGYKVVLASNGAEALSMVTEESPDLILLT